MFITATAPNPLLVALIAQATGSSIHITWGQWALAALLPCLCMSENDRPLAAFHGGGTRVQLRNTQFRQGQAR